MATEKNDAGDTGRLTKTLKWVRIAVIAVAVIGLSAYVFTLNIAPASAGKPIGH